MNTGGLDMINAEWKNGYEAGFAAGWKAAKNESQNISGQPTHTIVSSYPSVSYSTDPYYGTMMDSCFSNKESI